MEVEFQVPQQWGQPAEAAAAWPMEPSDRQTQNTSPNSRAQAPINFVKCARVRETIPVDDAEAEAEAEAESVLRLERAEDRT